MEASLIAIHYAWGLNMIWCIRAVCVCLRSRIQIEWNEVVGTTHHLTYANVVVHSVHIRFQDAAITTTYLFFGWKIDNWENISTAPSDTRHSNRWRHSNWNAPVPVHCAMPDFRALRAISISLNISPSRSAHTKRTHLVIRVATSSAIKTATIRTPIIICVCRARIEDSFVIRIVVDEINEKPWTQQYFSFSSPFSWL